LNKNVNYNINYKLNRNVSKNKIDLKNIHTANNDNISVKSEISDHAKKQIVKNVRTVGANRKNWTSAMNSKDLETMDDMELFSVIDANFIKNIDLTSEMFDFPRIKYIDSKVMVIWNSEIFGFNINIVRPCTNADFKISKY